jgi:hypothetical protein
VESRQVGVATRTKPKPLQLVLQRYTARRASLMTYSINALAVLSSWKSRWNCSSDIQREEVGFPVLPSAMLARTTTPARGDCRVASS